MAGHDPIPVLCRACGAPVDAVGEVSLACPYCGERDELPAEAHARVRELRRRLTARARAVGRLSAVHEALAVAFERSTWSAFVESPLGLGVAVVVSAPVLAVMGPIVTHRPEGWPLMLLGALLSMAPFLGLPLAGVVAFRAGRRLYRAELRDLLRARPPRRGEVQARCRCCAAGLPDERGPLRRCRHCRSLNLVTVDGAAREAGDLAAEERASQAQLAAAAARAGDVGRRLDRLLLTSYAWCYGVILAVTWLGSCGRP